MAGNIKKIVLQNFKAFNGVNEIDLEGKHLLLYGENGSGKSSIYWGLYTLLQSITKDNTKTDKYFDFLNDENLINKDYIFHLNDTIGSGLYNSSIGKNVQIEIVQEDDKVLNLSLGGLSAATNKTELENLNRYSDFLTHRLLINFYNFRNSQEIDLWKVFTRDIFPFVYEDLDNGVETIENLVNELNNTQPFTVNAAGEIVPSVVQQDYFDYYSRISYVNNEIYKWVKFIENEANQFFNEYFDDNKNNFIINLDYTDRFYYNFHKIIIKNNSEEYEVMSSYKYLRTPKIILKIFKKVKNHWTSITRPQTFLNEALITQISLSIRLAITKSRAVNYPGQFLVLDDLLISLDMSNRDKVLDIILNVFAPKYKIYMLTHERAFFNMAKARIESEHSKDDWNFKELYGIDEDHNKPQINNSDDFITKSITQYKQKDYPASVNYLRKELEKILNDNLPTKVKKGDTGEDKNTLDSIISSAISHLEKLSFDTLPLKKCQQYLQILLNPLSHNENDIDAYETDIKRIRNVIEELKPFLVNLKKRTKEIFPRLRKVSLTITENDKITKQKYTLQLQEDLYLIMETDGSIRLSDCKINSLESRTYIEDILQEKESYKNEHWKHNSVYELYSAICSKKDIYVNPIYFEYFETLEGKPISDFF